MVFDSRPSCSACDFFLNSYHASADYFGHILYDYMLQFIHSMLQALKALCHNYPNVMASCWKQVSAIVYQFLKLEAFRVPSGKGTAVHDGGSTAEKLVAAAVRV